MNSKGIISFLIVFHFTILISFSIMYYLFMQDSYPDDFWDWSWDMSYFLKDKSTNAGLAWMFVWIPLFVVDFIAIFAYLTIYCNSIFEHKNNQTT